jgi:hypothetical protein
MTVSKSYQEEVEFESIEFWILRYKSEKYWLIYSVNDNNIFFHFLT